MMETKERMVALSVVPSDRIGEREMEGEKKKQFTKTWSISVKLLDYQARGGASQPFAQLKRYRNIRQVVHWLCQDILLYACIEPLRALIKLPALL